MIFTTYFYKINKHPLIQNVLIKKKKKKRKRCVNFYNSQAKDKSEQ